MPKTDLLYLFDRPTEPVYVPKGNEKVSLNIPRDYLTDRYQPIAERILTRFGNEGLSSVDVRQIAIPSGVKVAYQIGRQEQFTLFMPRHGEIAGKLIEIFLGMRNAQDLLSLAAYLRDRINPELFIYVLSVAILHHPETKDLELPQLSEIFPSKYFNGNVFNRAREEATVVTNPAERVPIEIPENFTSSNKDPEHVLAFFREDIGVNLHHWHWHLIYPFDAPITVVRKDRRGELFYYMHHQFMARYATERIAHGLAPVEPLTNLRSSIPEGYFPKLDSVVAGRSWPARPAGMVLSDIQRPVDNYVFTLRNIEQSRDRILQAIQRRQVVRADGRVEPLTDFEGIDVLGNMVEASILSPDRNFYGDLHNQGHMAIAFSHDPDHRYLENFGIMGDTTTAMRDPIFYRWHTFIDNVFNAFKDSLNPYQDRELNFPNVTVTSATISTTGSRSPNLLQTFWTRSSVDLSRGLDFTPRGSVLANIVHLNHDPFTYSIRVRNANNQPVFGTVRIFIGPKNDVNNRSLPLRQQKNLMIEMDKFLVRLIPGENNIERNSSDSALTIPFGSTFRNLDANRPATTSPNFEAFNYCGCGWPEHMLVPKGTANGFQMELFVMISNYEDDKVVGQEQQPNRDCRTGMSFCGLRDKKYPDARSMGFPFDRNPPQGTQTLAAFLRPNMRLTPITIRFEDTRRDARRRN